jgi:hypothetical protein
LTRSDRIEQSNYRDGESFFFEIGEGEELVDHLRRRIAPSTADRGAQYEIIRFGKDRLRRFAVHLGGGEDDHSFGLLRGKLQNYFSAFDVGF